MKLDESELKAEWERVMAGKAGPEKFVEMLTGFSKGWRMKFVAKGRVTSLRVQHWGEGSSYDGELEVVATHPIPEWSMNHYVMKFPVEIAKAPKVGSKITITVEED